VKNKDFVEYQEALELKQLGFNEPCLAFYNSKFLNSTQYDFDNCSMKDIGQCLLAPTYSQAFRWFREKYGIGSWIHHYFDMDKGTFIYSYVLTLPHRGEEYVYDTHEEGELACLKKLIEIVK